MVSIKTLLLEMVDEQGACHIRELHIEILREKPGTPEHTIRARLSEAVADGVGALVLPGLDVSEYELHQRLSWADSPIVGFGSSDCGCRSHLAYVCRCPGINLMASPAFLRRRQATSAAPNRAWRTDWWL